MGRSRSRQASPWIDRPVVALLELVVVEVAVIPDAARALRSRGDLLGDVGAAPGTLGAGWLVVVAAVTLAPVGVAYAAAHDKLVESVPVPTTPSTKSAGSRVTEPTCRLRHQ